MTNTYIIKHRLIIIVMTFYEKKTILLTLFKKDL